MNKYTPSHFSLIDWDYETESSRHYIHNLCWYPARFIPIIPAQLIANFSSPGNTVLDPFCGSGTTAVEALKLGRNSVSADLAPVAFFLTSVKTQLLMLENAQPDELHQLLADIRLLRRRRHGNPQLFDDSEQRYPFGRSRAECPNLSENRKWYHPATLLELTDLHHLVSMMPQGLFQNIARILFFSTLMPSTAYPGGRSYTYYADNVKPKGQLLYKDALKYYSTRLTGFLREYEQTKTLARKSISSEVYQCDARSLLQTVERPCELIVTSPPYLGVTDYTTGFRLAYLWFSFSEDFNELKQQEIGARYQRHRKTERRVSNYKNDLDISLDQMLFLLKPKGYLCLVLGEPQKYRSTIREHVLDLVTNKYGLSLQGTFSRRISKKFFLHPQGGVSTEDILIFRKV